MRTDTGGPEVIFLGHHWGVREPPVLGIRLWSRSVSRMVTLFGPPSLTYNPVLLCIEASLPRHEESHPGTGDHAAPVHTRIAWLPWASWPPGWCIHQTFSCCLRFRAAKPTGLSPFELPVLVRCGAVFPSLAHLQPQSHVDRTNAGSSLGEFCPPRLDFLIHPLGIIITPAVLDLGWGGQMRCCLDECGCYYSYHQTPDDNGLPFMWPSTPPGDPEVPAFSAGKWR